jgi:SsrA-binding protein
MAAKSKKKGDPKAQQWIAQNRKARHEYEILDRMEAGIVLRGPEVKSLREGRANLADAYADVERGEVWLRKLHISPYEQANRENADPTRPRKLLMHRSEIARLSGRVVERGLTLIPLALYWKEGRAKVELGLARGRRSYDKRQAIRKREDDREARRAVRQNVRYRDQ